MVRVRVRRQRWGAVLAVTVLLLALTRCGCWSAVLPEPTAEDDLARSLLEGDAAAWAELGGGNNVEGGKTMAVASALTRYVKWAEERKRILPTAPAIVEDEWVRALEHDRRWRAVQPELRQLRRLYEQWWRLTSAEDGAATRDQWVKFAAAAANREVAKIDEGYLKGGRALPDLLEALRMHVFERNLFNNVLLRALDEQQACQLDTSPHRLVYDVWEQVARAQLDGHVVLQWSHAVLKAYGEDGGEDDVSEAAAETRTRYELARVQTRTKAKAALKRADKSRWVCDPSGGHRVTSGGNSTYAEVTRLLQGYIENEKDMNARSNCMQDCSYYDYTTSMGCYAGYCKRQPQPCRGKLLDCRYVYKDMTVCEAQRGGTRRYDHIEYDNDRTLGRVGSCPAARSVRVESWWRWLFWHCSYCMCLCDDASSSLSDRRWSLRPALADAERGYVVTGVQLVKKSRVFHLRVQQALLEARGRVNRTSARWLPVDEFDVSDRHAAAEGRDYHTMRYEARDLDLDDVIVPAGHVVTGVQWRVVGSHLNVEVQATPVDWRGNGVLVAPRHKSFWVSSDSTLGREKLRLGEADVPTRQTQPSQVDSQTDMYVEFTNSDLEKDVGQTTVPFLDTQPVASEPVAPLSGVGLYHKGQRGYGGYVAPKIITYDYLPHMRD